MNKQKIIAVKGSKQEINDLLALFEDGQIGEFDNFSILDIVKIRELSTAKERSPISQPQEFLNTIQQGLTNLSQRLIEFWQDCLELKGRQLAVRKAQDASTIEKVIPFPKISTELIIRVSEINEDEIQVFLRLRAIDGKGYLPENLVVCVFDDEGKVLLESRSSTQTNLLDITSGSEFTCSTGDRFSISLTLGNETIIENFPR